MISSILATVLLGPSAISLETKLAKPVFFKGEKIRVEVYAVNHSDRPIVVGKSEIGNYASGHMKSKVQFAGPVQIELHNYNPNLGQIVSGRTLNIKPDDFVVVPPQSKALVFFDQIDGEWKDGYTRSNAPYGIQPILIPARVGTYRFNYTYEFNRRNEENRIKRAAFSPGYKLDEHVIPDRRSEIVYQGNARDLFDQAVEGKWSVSGEFKIVNK